MYCKHTPKGRTIRKVIVGGEFSACSPGYLIEQNFNQLQLNTIELNSIRWNSIMCSNQTKSNLKLFVGLNIELIEFDCVGFPDVSLDMPGLQDFFFDKFALVVNYKVLFVFFQ